MRDDILTIIAGHRDVTNVVVLTFNIDLVFVETVLLRSLRGCGYPSMTILADAEEVTRTFQGQSPWLSAVGHRFRVVPVWMGDHFRFHPKIVLLSGVEHAELLVGSGNASFGGFRQNAEIWVSFQTEIDGTAPFAAAKELFSACLERSKARPEAQAEIHEAFDPSTHSWSRKLESPADVLWRVGRGETLLDQVEAAVGRTRVERITICSPYFDDSGQAIRTLAKRWPKARIELLVQPETTELTRGILKSSGTHVRLKCVSANRSDGSRGFVHAKFYAFASRGQVVLFAGSANCSVAGLTAGGNAGNAEALAVQRLTARRFNDEVLDDLAITSDVPELAAETAPETSPAESPQPVRIVSASLVGRSLHVSFAAQQGFQVDTCRIDEQVVTLHASDLREDGFMIDVDGSPAVVALEGSWRGERVVSRLHWVDHEWELSASGRQRQFALGLKNHVSPATWNLGAWAELLRLLGDHLRYTPSRPIESTTDSPNREDEVRTYSDEDFITANYRLPSRATPSATDQAVRILGLQRLLLDYFGLQPEQEPGDAVESDEESDEGNDQGESARQGTRGGKRPPVSTGWPQEPSEAERRRARRFADLVAEQLVDEEFIQHRSPSLLGRDLAVTAILLVAGTCEKWLPEDAFFELSHKIWTRMFLDRGTPAPEAIPTGWLEWLSRNSKAGDQYKQELRRVELTAALFLWMSTCPSGASAADAIRFRLATRLAVARLPWLWNLDRTDEVAREIERIASRTKWFEGGRNWRRLVQSWGELIVEGHALHRLEMAISKHDLTYWRKVVETDVVDPGELLWQGRLGFAIATVRASRAAPTGSKSVRVLLLGSDRAEADIAPGFLLPVRGLAKALSSMSKTPFNQQHAETIEQLLNRIAAEAR